MELHEVLDGLKEQKAVCRFSPEFVMYFKPHPKTYPPELLAGLKEHSVKLAGILVPHAYMDYRARPHWTQINELRGCYACDRSTVLTDPLGNFRHSWCGWTNQHISPPAKAPGYPKKVDSGVSRPPMPPPDYPVGECKCGRTSIRLYDGDCFWCRRGTLT